MSTLTFKNGYELEFAIDSKNEFEALNIISQIFGYKIKNEVNIYGIAKRSNLIFINHRFIKADLTDDNYRKLHDHGKLLTIVNDELSAERASELLKICIPVETLLKRLLIYVWPEILIALDKKDYQEKQAKIDICNNINRLSLGKLINLLEVDLSEKSREAIMCGSNKPLFILINESENFDNLKDKIKPFIEPYTIWSQINIILEKPVEYSHISKQIRSLKLLRDKAAHPQTILKADLKKAQKDAKHIVDTIGKIRNDYYNALSDSIKKIHDTFEQTSEYISKCISDVVNENTLKTMSETIPKETTEAIQKISKIISASNITKAVANINWGDIAAKVRKADPEIDAIFKKFENDGAKNALDSLNESLKKELDSNDT